MSTQVYIDYNRIPDSDIIEYPLQEETIEFNRDKLIASTVDIVLGNDENEYSPFSPLSIFYHSDWYNKPVELYDSDNGIYTFKGRIKDIVIDDKRKTVTVKAANFVRDLSDSVLSYVNTDQITPAELILNIIQDHVEIDPDYINQGSFLNVINVQDAASVYADLNYSTEDNITCLSVIEELCRITGCHVFTINNIIYIWSWEEYSGALGTRIQAKDIEPASFSSQFADSVVNAYKIAYKNGASVAYKTTDYPTSLTASIAKFGTRTFNVPNENIESTTATDFKILLQTAAAAQWCGNRQVDRYSDMTQKFSLVLDDAFSFLHLNDQMDLDFGDFTREPVRITRLQPNRGQKQIAVEGEFLNLPVNRVTRDEEAPIAPQLVAALPGRKKVLLKWTANQEADLVGYYIYLTATRGMWYQEICHLGKSPIEIKNPSISSDGYCYAEIRELSPGTVYYFRVSAFDSSYNEGEPSNVLVAVPLHIDNAANWVNVDGNEFDAIELDAANSREGTAPAGFAVFDDAEFDVDVFAPSGIWESPVYYHPSGYDFIRWKGITDGDGIDYQLRISDDGSTWTSWGTAASAVGSMSVAVGAKYFQIRFLFNADSWADSDWLYIQNLEAS